jgi:NAD(P)-dependent dehydrogenase (short-subunit alcohol dehydrogenase family)
MMKSRRPVIAITGGSKGLGYALAAHLLQHDFAVSICARHANELAHATQELERFGPILSASGDIADPSFQRRFIDATVDSFGRLDGIVNNASTLGTLPMPTVQDTDLPNLSNVLNVNTVAAVGLVQQSLPHLLTRTRGLILGISSDAAVGGYANWGIYGASKAALDLLHKTLADELDGQDIHVFAVDPGDMDTDMHRDASPLDEGLPKPDLVAQALLPLFLPLRTTASFPFPSGTRLQVQNQGLCPTEVS